MFEVAITPTSRDCKVTVDGIDITNYVGKITINAQGGEVTRMNLEIVPTAYREVMAVVEDKNVTVITSPQPKKH